MRKEVRLTIHLPTSTAFPASLRRHSTRARLRERKSASISSSTGRWRKRSEIRYVLLRPLSICQKRTPTARRYVQRTPTLANLHQRSLTLAPSIDQSRRLRKHHFPADFLFTSAEPRVLHCLELPPPPPSRCLPERARVRQQCRLRDYATRPT